MAQHDDSKNSQRNDQNEPLSTVFFGDPDHIPDGMERIDYRLGDPWPGGPEFVASKGCSWIPEDNIFLIVDDATPDLIADLQRPVDVFVVGHGPLVGLILNFGNAMDTESLRWSRPGQPIPEPITYYTERLAMGVALVDHKTKRIAHLRAFTLSPHATKTLQRECRDRWAEGTDEAGGAAAFAEFEARYPTMAAAKRGSFARCHAGD